MRNALALVALTLAALALRMWGIDHCVPHYKEADAHMALHVELIRQGATEPDKQHNDAQYPIVLPGALSLLPDTQADPGSAATLEEHLAAAAHVYVETRVEIAVLGVLAIPLTFLLARRFLAHGWSLFAAALVATSFLHQFFAQQARPHAAAASVFLLAVLAAMRLARRPNAWNHLLALAAAALSIGTLQSGLATLLPLAVASWLGTIRVVHEPAPKLALRLASPLFALPLIALASFAVFYPYLRYEGTEAAYASPVVDGTTLVWGDHRLDLHDWKGQGFVTLARTLWFYEPVLLGLLVLAGAALAARKLAIYRPLERWTDFWVAAAFVLPYLIAVGLFRNTFERFLLPLLPYLAVCAAWGLSFWSEKLTRVPRAVSAVAAAATLALPTFACARLAWLRSRDDTLELAAQWFSHQSDATRTPIYVIPFFDLPLARSAESLQPGDKRPAAILSRWSVYQKRRGPQALPEPRFDLRYLVPRPDLGFPWPKAEADPAGYLRALGPGYFVLDMSRQPTNLGLDRVRESVRQLGTLVHREAPEADGATREFGFPFEDELVPDWPNVLARALRIEAVGPVVEIYRVR